MKPIIFAAVLVGLLQPIPPSEASRAGDSIYGRITDVRRADQVVFAHASGTYNLRIAGVVVPEDSLSAGGAAAFVRGLVLNRDVRMRMEGGRLRTGELQVRLFTADSVPGIRDVGIEMVRAGVVRRQANYDYKYGELARAEAEAREARRGVWRSP